MSVAVPEQAKKYIRVQRVFVPEGTDPFSTVEWKKVDAVQVNQKGEEKFRQNDVEVPAWWNETQVNVVVAQYFRKVNGVKETSARQVFHRVAHWLAYNGVKQGIFEGNTYLNRDEPEYLPGNYDYESKDAKAFYDELVYMGLHGMHAFNSPVWYNVGTDKDHQCSACFIQSAHDTMDQIMDLAKREVMLFKRGSGTGSNISTLRSSYEGLTSGGIASGPVSFMEGFDAFAGVTKSGGGTRRAAKMVVLNVRHPDILQQKNGKPGFITCKAVAEDLAHDLYSTGKYTAEFNVPGNVYELVPFQNANNSVRVDDEFMRAVQVDETYNTEKVKGGEVVHTYKAKKVWEEICKAAWKCGDPGIQFDTTTNDWHTSKASGRINASNPCSEYLYLDDTACNLSSLNLRKFTDGKSFNVPHFIHATQLAITAKEIIVDASTYPSELLKENSHKYRTLGLGYTSLGSLLTYWGLAYDSNEGRSVAAAITAIMGGVAYTRSAHLAEVLGPFPEWYKQDATGKSNGEHMKDVIRKHLAAAKRIPAFLGPWHTLSDAAVDVWKDALQAGDKFGYRNAQTTLIAPTGTISFMMGASTTGCEPSLGVVTYKKLVGGGFMQLPNEDVKPALENLGYKADEVEAILEHIKLTGDIHSSSDFKTEQHGAVFAEALGNHAISPEAHIDMMAAIQPFLSGGISKTVNMPKDCTWEDISDVYMRAWKNGIKCVAVYRDGCKLSQPIATSVTDAGKKEKQLVWGQRKHLAATRDSVTHKFSVGGQEGYLTVSLFDDGAPAEMFIKLAKTGSTMNGILDAWAMNLSIALQYGAPFDMLKEKHLDLKFDPSGFTENSEIRVVKSIPDYIFRWLDLKFGPKAQEIKSVSVEEMKPIESKSFDGPPCTQCGNMTKRAGSCYCCQSCGATTGCS